LEEDWVGWQTHHKGVPFEQEKEADKGGRGGASGFASQQAADFSTESDREWPSSVFALVVGYGRAEAERPGNWNRQKRVDPPNKDE
jgi:hypothetical protein